MANGVKHSLHHAMPTLIRAMYILPVILRSAHKTGCVADKLGRPDIASVHKYELEMRESENFCIGIVTVRENPQGEMHFYDFGFLNR